ncbi:MAG: diguanylate cyclase [Acidimicrobiia bacterium]|nr:diguanylate cyclase [Acidimicrobiia bacterium]
MDTLPRSRSSTGNTAPRAVSNSFRPRSVTTGPRVEVKVGAPGPDKPLMAGPSETPPSLLARSAPTLSPLALEAIARVAFEDRLERALGPATSIDAVLEVAGRAMQAAELGGAGIPAPTELLLAHPRTGKFSQVIEVGPEGEGPGCPAAATGGCEALRTGRTQVYDDADAFDACPNLRDREAGPCSAACVPLVVLGDAIGVLHRTGLVGTPPSSLAVAQLEALGGRLGTRLALLRALDAPAPATLDRATGALDRPSIEARALELARSLVPFSLAQCDADGFEDYATTFGHETAERALRTVATAAREILRPDDLVGRFGEDELLVVLPETSAGECQRALERLREHLSLTLTASGLPPLTCSYGVVESSLGRSLDELLVAADAAVALAKDRGRNRVVVARENMLDEYPGVA